MIAVVGDIHGDLGTLHQLSAFIVDRGANLIIQVGDFGFFPKVLHKYHSMGFKWPLPVYAIDGNHEDFNLLIDKQDVTEMLPNIYYVPRGTVMELDGRRFAFMGGAASIDKDYRIRQKLHWDGRENIRREDMERLDRNLAGQPVDFFIAHCPPQRVIQEHFEKDPYRKVRAFGVPVDWRDANADLIELAWMKMGHPPLICGHMHETVKNGKVRILDINEVVLI